MIREMRVSDWNEMMDIYKQSLERGGRYFSNGMSDLRGAG